MVVRVHLGILAGIVCYYIGSGPSEPTSVVAHRGEAGSLAALEDAFAQSPADASLATELLDQYLERDRPALALGVLRLADPSLLDHPLVAHRMAEAYERTGRPREALATAKVARARCGRALGSTAVGALSPVPATSCSEGLLAALEAHVDALERMVRWGVVFSDKDPRVARAYRMAIRRASVAMGP